MQCDHSNQMLQKANQAMKILHYKLQKERKTVARLQASGTSGDRNALSRDVLLKFGP